MKLDLSGVERPLKEILTREVRRNLSRIADEGKQKLEHTVSSWSHKPTFRFRTRLYAGSYTVTFYVSEPGLPVWTWACYGTQTHEIKPRGPYPLRLRFYPPKSWASSPWTSGPEERGWMNYYYERYAWRVRNHRIYPRGWHIAMAQWLRGRVRELLERDVVEALEQYGKVRFVSRTGGEAVEAEVLL